MTSRRTITFNSVYMKQTNPKIPNEYYISKWDCEAQFTEAAGGEISEERFIFLPPSGTENLHVCIGRYETLFLSHSFGILTKSNKDPVTL